jgi:hypothetical protein
MGPPMLAPNSFWCYGGGQRKEAAGVEIGIAEVFVSPAVKLVGTRLEHVIGYPLPLVIGLGAGGLYLKLVHGLHRNSERQVARIALGPGAGQRQTFNVDLVLIGLAAVE